MATQEIVQVMAELVPEGGKALARIQGPRALIKAQAIESALLPRLEENAGYAQIWQQFRGDPATMAPALGGILQVLLAADAALAQRLDALLAEYRQAAARTGVTSIQTEGGAYVGGGVSVDEGTFVGRDQVVHGDAIARVDAVVKGLSGEGSAAVGPGAQVTVTRGIGDDALVQLFERAYQHIQARPPDPDVDKDEIAEVVRQIQEEVAKGDQANPKKVERWLGFLAGMAGDVFDVVVACLTGPWAGVAAVVRKVAERAKKEAETSQ